MPTYRYKQQLLDIYTTPELIARQTSKQYLIAEGLSALGKVLEADGVLIDLRAGMSEFSAPILFDARVKKYIVTSTSFQSIKGTKIVLEEVTKGLIISAESTIPEVLLTMIPKELDVGDIKSELLSMYPIDNADFNYTDNLITELPFASELIHLASLDQIMRDLEGRNMYQKIRDLVKNNYFSSKMSVDHREEAINSIHVLAKAQITAEGNSGLDILVTRAINNLLLRFQEEYPCVVVMGAKGSGKTFLYREMLRSMSWKGFSSIVSKDSAPSIDASFVPVLSSANSSYLDEIIRKAYESYNKDHECGYVLDFFYKNRVDTQKYFESKHSISEWTEYWKRILLPNGIESIEHFAQYLEKKNKKVVLLFDGIEDLIQNVDDERNISNAIIALCQNLVEEIRIRYKTIGIIIFMRKDIIADSIGTNSAQFFSQYQDFELNWSKTEALRMVLWLVSHAVKDFYDNKIVDIQSASEDLIRQTLTKLWGIKLGQNDSNEAYSSNWILAALSDFNGQLQARDVIRFLEYATEKPGVGTYSDRYLMPNEIKKAVPPCSEEKINEIQQEIKKLKPIIGKINSTDPSVRTLPFSKDTFSFTPEEEDTLKREGYLIVDNDKYYLPEIMRFALQFRYDKGARPKVLSLMNRKR